MQAITPLHPRIILGVVAHPDDLEFGMAGSVATWVKQGAKVYYYILTNGNKGTEDRSLTCDQLRDMRRLEQRRAAKILGVSDVFFSNYEDGSLANTLDVKRDIVRKIREIQPDVVMTMDPTMRYVAERDFINHPDHRAAGDAVLDACYPLARDHMSFPELLIENLEPHKVQTVLMLNFEKQNFYVDITEALDTKLQALGAHSSQIGNAEATYAMVREWASSTGKKAGSEYAEGFVRIDVT